MMSERKEGWMRIVVGIVSGIILGIWRALVVVLGIVNFFVVIFSNKRNQGIADFCEIWNTQIYIFLKYMTFVTNERPFPFKPLTPSMSKFGLGKVKKI
ncbi:MAG: DUF4389 domain-containing protein [archaeon]